jgi:hypothetical protein
MVKHLDQSNRLLDRAQVGMHIGQVFLYLPQDHPRFFFFPRIPFHEISDCKFDQTLL